MSNQLATTNKRDIKTLLMSEDVKQRLHEVLPTYLTADRMTRIALATITKVPKLANCTPESLLLAMMTCAQAGLEPDGRHAHLIPYGDQVQVIFDYKGLVHLATLNGVKNIRAEKVCDADEFDYRTDGGAVKFTHKVDWRKPRGEPFAYYATCERDGILDVEVMQKSEVDAIRKRSKAGSSGPWVTDFDEMAKKTVLRRMSKRWPLSAEIASALMADDDRPTERERAMKDVTPRFSKAPVAALPAAEERPAAAEFDYLEAVLGLCIRDNIEVDAVMAVLVADGSAKPGKKLHDMKPAALKVVFENWTEIVAKAKPAPHGATTEEVKF